MNAPAAQGEPRAIALTNRFPGNVRQDLLEALLASLWRGLVGQLADSLRVNENDRQRSVTFMGAARFTVDKRSGRVSVSQLSEKKAKLMFVDETRAAVIDLPARLNGFWLDAFLVPWRHQIGECLIDHHATGSGMDWMESVKRELQRALRRSTHWYRLRCALRDALQLDPQIVMWCRRGRPALRDYITQVRYNDTVAERATYQRIQDDNPNLLWLYNVLQAEGLQPTGDQPVAAMKAWLLGQGGISEAGWRLIANGKEQDFRHIIDFVDESGGISGRHAYLPKWVRMLGKLRRGHSVPRPLLGLFAHDTYDGLRTEAGDRVRFRGVLLQPGVLRAILDEGERRLAHGSHRRFVEDVVEIMTWLQSEKPVLDKNQLRQGWKYLALRAASWKVECETCDTLKHLAWESALPETQIGPWRVVPLTDAWQLRREALSQRHCADQYLEECLDGKYRLFSVRTEQDKPVATIGIERGGMDWSVFAFRAFANRPVRDTLTGLEDEVAQRYSQLWRLTVPAAPSMPQVLDRDVALGSDGACPYCGEAHEACAHTLAVRDADSGELTGGVLYEAYDELNKTVEEEIRYAALNGEFRFGVNDACRLLAHDLKKSFDEEHLQRLRFSRLRDISDVIFEWLEGCMDVKVTACESLDGAPGTYRFYWASEPAGIVAWLRAQFEGVSNRDSSR
jgi:hypothetical protein